MQRILVDILKERDAQDIKWGEQNHPDTSHGHRVHYNSHLQIAEDWKFRNKHRAQQGTVAWDGILLEEAYEACGETDLERKVAELIQVAAVAVAWVEAIQRRQVGEQLALFPEPVL